MRLPWRHREVDEIARLRGVLDGLSDSNVAAPDPDRERALLRARHLAGIALVDGAGDGARFPETDGVVVPAGDPLPELCAGELTAPLLRAAILRDGCALVRGLIPTDVARGLADGIDAAYAQREAIEAGEAQPDGLYDEFSPEPRYGEIDGRGWIKVAGGLLGADSPSLCFRFLQALREAGVDRLVGDYLGEPALISVHKTTMRRAEPAVGGAWHQDGRFMGPVRSLNLWLALSDCGRDAPGLDLVPTRLDDYLATGTEGAALSWTISEIEVSTVPVPVTRPVFAPGDALLFDELFLHKTGSEPSMPHPRYAIENWFFGPSGFPADYAPLAV